MKPPIVCERMDANNVTGISARVMVRGEQWRNAVFINDTDDPTKVAEKLRSLANWIDRKIGE